MKRLIVVLLVSVFSFGLASAELLDSQEWQQMEHPEKAAYLRGGA